MDASNGEPSVGRRDNDRLGRYLLADILAVNRIVRRTMSVLTTLYRIAEFMMASLLEPAAGELSSWFYRLRPNMYLSRGEHAQC